LIELIEKKVVELMEKGYRSGFAAIIGRPNVGKSTLMNKMIGEKIAIISDKPQTTRSRIQCVLTRENYQIVFIDTPGLHKPRNKLGEYMVNTAVSTLKEVDIILFVIDIAAGMGNGDKIIAEMLKDVDTPVIVVFNKKDKLSTEDLEKEINKFTQSYSFSDSVAVSALTGENLDRLEEKILSYLPEGPQYYPSDMITDQPERIIIAEIIREKALELLKDEVPHGIGVEIEKINEREDRPLMDIHAVLYCEKKSHKGIIIGKGGQMLRKIGENARRDIENLLGTKVYLDIWVKISEDWRNNRRALRELGYE